MQCHHFDAGECRSCTLLPLPRARQVGEGEERVRALLAPHLGAPAEAVWQPPITGAEQGFRARGKMAVTGTAQDPVLGLPGSPRPRTSPTARCTPWASRKCWAG